MTIELFIVIGIFLMCESIIIMILLRDLQLKNEEIKQLMNVIKIKNIEKFKN